LNQPLSAYESLERSLTPEELENNSVFNPKLVFRPNSSLLPELEALCKTFVDLLAKDPIPSGLTHPIACGPKRERISWRNIQTLFANLFLMKAKEKSTMSVSLNNNYYSDTPLSAGFINLVKLAAHPSRGYLVLKEGFRNPQNPKHSRLSRIATTRKFSDLVDSIVVNEDEIISEPHELINLKRGRKGRRQIVPPKEWLREITPHSRKQLGQLKSNLLLWNHTLRQFEFSYREKGKGETRYLYPALYAVFTNDFHSGGRLYTGRGGHQQLSKRERSTIEINGQSTVELDFGGLHLRMMYHLIGREYPLDSDPYTDVLDAAGLNAREVEAEYPQIRNDLKKMLLAMINDKADDPEQILFRANRRLFECWLSKRFRKSKEARDKAFEACQDRIERWTSIGLVSGRRGAKPSASRIIKAFRKAHEPIREEFSQGRGLDLQNLDAQIAWRVLERIGQMSLGAIPCLPVHDSFITFEDCSELLQNVMQACYREVMQENVGLKREFPIPVKSNKTK